MSGIDSKMSKNINNYYDQTAILLATQEGRHRNVVGGLWDEIGELQLSCLLSRGLTPRSNLLDIGCGSLRLGVRAIRFLDAERYFGTDLNKTLIDAGRTFELDESLRAKAPLQNFSANSDFDFGFLNNHKMNYVIAQSVFSHLPLNHLRRCLAQLKPFMECDGQFLMTYFECPPDHNLFEPITHHPGGIVTHDFMDPFHYKATDLYWAAEQTGWALELIGDWNHPRNQKMAVFHPQ
jgi:SAM-dependent methyltransferase